MKTYGENPSFSNQKNLEETEEQHDEVNKVECGQSPPKAVCFMEGKQLTVSSVH